MGKFGDSSPEGRRDQPSWLPLWNHLLSSRPREATKLHRFERDSGRREEVVHTVRPRGRRGPKTPFKERPHASGELPSQIAEIGEGVREIRAREARIAGRASFSQVSEKQAEAYLRTSLKIAGSTLDKAREALRTVKQDSKPVEVEKARKSIEALSDVAVWDGLLEARGLAQDQAARAAVKELAARIATISPTDIKPDSVQALLRDIEFLRQIVASASSERGVLLSPTLVQECLAATSRIGTEIMLGLVAILASTEAAGETPIRMAVVCTGIGLGAQAAAKEIWRRFSHVARAHTVETQLQQHHHEMLEAIADLAIFLGCLVGDDPPTPEQRRLLGSIQLAAQLLVNHVEQLAISIEWVGGERYCQVLSQVRQWLTQLPQIIARADRHTARAAIDELRDAHSQLALFTNGIDELKPSWRPR